jgi:hypothetical protein
MATITQPKKVKTKQAVQYVSMALFVQNVNVV